MMNEHLKDDELQAIASMQQVPSSEQMQHIKNCPNCAFTLSLYQKIANTIAEQKVPSFDVNLVQLIIPQIEKKKSFKWMYWTIGLLFTFFILFACILFEKQIQSLFASVSNSLLVMAVTSALVILFAQLREITSRYRLAEHTLKTTI